MSFADGVSHADFDPEEDRAASSGDDSDSDSDGDKERAGTQHYVDVG